VQQRLSIHKKSFTCAAFSPFGKLLAVGSDEGDLYLWDWSVRGVRLHVPLGHDVKVLEIVYAF
jgi:WD40 repeat protein